ncbi:Ig-like domain-containing protein [Yersinia enterocolitica]|uniref:Ig-like domain-containing protein n=1 Tax=Yersinia enterocolitica TaxID=630 RepID=UPI001C8EA31C|nr:Ig-like domain-containing protein [Yersinia enterocolitica]EKN4180495.1 Ig-like domain-containing protein [Yersinia enterocolitica]MBX9487377.1 Ig-like domain-containing protein [Yersinia enterocolitica]MBX9490711.1 Ig-like domain-containing protein [Yersinia enterocolitica]HEN3447322.1 Ig-like domain-containing protein [Yersinia enterocolitica]
MLHRYGIFNGLLLALIIVMSHTVQAIQQSTTPTSGRAPTTTLSINNTQPQVGDVINVTSAFNDADGDIEQGTTYQWMLDGAAISGATNPSYTLSLSDILAGSELNVVVIPQTDPNLTHPSEGLPVQLPYPINIRWQQTITHLEWVESPLGVIADGQAVNTVRATVQYLDGTPAAGVTVLFDADNMGVISAVVQTGVDGVATAYVTNTHAGITQVTASINDESQSINTFFVAGPVYVVHAEVTQDNAVANGIDDNNVLITAEDNHGNSVVDETINFTATNGVTLLTTSGQTDSNGEVTIALTSQSAVNSEVTATASNGVSNAVTVEFFDEIHMTHILVNGASFSVSYGFPSTGFVGAEFQLVVGEKPAENSAYQWHADQSWVSVDGSGNVRFNQEPTSANSSVIITAVHQGNGSSLTYQFSLNRWFRNNGSAFMVYSDAAAWCSSQGGYAVPGYAQMTDRTPAVETGAARHADGRLWNEWGPMSRYANGWFAGNYWANELTSDGNARHYAYLGNGNLFSFPLDGATYATCSTSF